MKYIFFGTPEFAAIILKKLIAAGFIPEAVVCNPDKPVGRKKIITPPAVKLSIMNQVGNIKDKIKILQPEKLNIQNIYNWCDRTNCIYQDCDFFIVAAYGQIIPKEILEIPRLGTIGVHPSLLPKYRGVSPIQTAILNGDKETGTTFYLMDEKIDNGPILAQKALENYELGIMNYESLMRKLAELSADLLIEILPNIEEKIKNAVSQNENQAVYTKKIAIEDAFIESQDLEKAQNGSAGSSQVAAEIDRKIRALNPEPGVWTFMDIKSEKKRVKLLGAELVDGKLKLTKIQVEGKKPQNTNLICGIV